MTLVSNQNHQLDLASIIQLVTISLSERLVASCFCIQEFRQIRNATSLKSSCSTLEFFNNFWFTSCLIELLGFSENCIRFFEISFRKFYTELNPPKLQGFYTKYGTCNLIIYIVWAKNNFESCFLNIFNLF